MPITLEKLFSPTLTVSFPFLEETVNVTWAPWRWTGEMQDLVDRMRAEFDAERDGLEERMKAAIEAEGADEETVREGVRHALVEMSKADMAFVREMLSRLLVSWDVLDDDGKARPTDMAEMKRLPDQFLTAVWQALAKESAPDPSSAPNSDEPSDTETGSAPSPAGTSTSEPPRPSVSRRSSSTNVQSGLATIPSGGIGA